MDNITQIIITVVTVAGSAGIWKFLEARLKSKADEKKAELENNDGVQYRDDLKNRVRNLEALLASSADEKDELRNQVLQLTAEVHALRVKVDFLTKENERLKDKYS
jgi:predicted nuclease with TOPRIM domain